MPKRVSGQRYAQAIFELALEQGQTDEWAADLELAGQVLRDKEFRTFLNHAEVPVADKIKSIEAVLPDIHPLVRNLLDVLVTKGLVNVAPELGDAYAKLLDIHHGRQRVEVISAVALDDAEVQRISQYVSGVTGKEVVVTTQIDEEILGGIVIQIGDQLLDGSTRTRLEALRTRVRTGVI
jgi:F-type H+-transporting ATPase subunit delta